MSLHMQLRRGLIALIIGLALFGFALGRAGFGHDVGTRAPGSGVHALTEHRCGKRLQIELDRQVRLAVVCDGACAPLGRVLRTLHVTAVPVPDCELSA